MTESVAAAAAGGVRGPAGHVRREAPAYCRPRASRRGLPHPRQVVRRGSTSRRNIQDAPTIADSMTANTYAFDGRTVLVTGGGSGIGRAIAHAFLDNGANVAISGRRRDKLDAALEGRPEERTLAIEADVGDDASAKAMVGAVVERFGGLDVLVNNAAAYFSGPFDAMTLDAWEAIRSTNIDGFVHVVRHSVGPLEESGGNVVVVGSVSGLRGDWGQ